MNFPSKEAKMLGQIKTRGWSVPVVERRPCAVNKEHDPPAPNQDILVVCWLSGRADS